MNTNEPTKFEILASKKLEELNANMDYHAIIKIYNLPTMTSYRKSRLIEWMRETADAIEKEEEQKDFDVVFTVRLMK